MGIHLNHLGNMCDIKSIIPLQKYVTQFSAIFMLKWFMLYVLYLSYCMMYDLELHHQFIEEFNTTRVKLEKADHQIRQNMLKVMNLTQICDIYLQEYHKDL